MNADYSEIKKALEHNLENIRGLLELFKNQSFHGETHDLEFTIMESELYLQRSIRECDKLMGE